MADNQKMWEELGMNLELHDQLCQVLPQAVGDVFLSQEQDLTVPVHFSGLRICISERLPVMVKRRHGRFCLRTYRYM